MYVSLKLITADRYVYGIKPEGEPYVSPFPSNLVPIKGGRVMIAFFINYSTVAFPLHLPTLKRQQFFWRGCKFAEKKFIFPATVGHAALCGANR